MNKFGENLRRIRTTKGMTQTELAGAIGIRQSTVAMYENGTRNPPMKNLVKLSDVMGCSIDEMVRGNEEEVQ